MEARSPGGERSPPPLSSKVFCDTSVCARFLGILYGVKAVYGPTLFSGLLLLAASRILRRRHEGA